jgi:hypothetical protein
MHIQTGQNLGEFKIILAVSSKTFLVTLDEEVKQL